MDKKLSTLKIYFFNSGKPAIDVSNDNNPAKSEADITPFQPTSSNMVTVPIVATAVYAIVFMALIPAAFSQSFITYTS